MVKMLYFSFLVFSFFTLLDFASGLGINCRGSGLCPLATFENNFSESVIQALRDAVDQSSTVNSTTYNNGDHVICVGTSLPISLSVGAGPISITLAQGSLGVGGICLFPQYMQSGLTLEQIKPLMDAVLQHGCTTCGSVPIHFVDQGSNDPSDGILTFNYVGKPDCIGTCISGNGQPNIQSQPTAAATVTIQETETVVAATSGASLSTMALPSYAVFTTTLQAGVSPGASGQVTAFTSKVGGGAVPTVTVTQTAMTANPGNMGRALRAPSESFLLMIVLPILALAMA